MSTAPIARHSVDERRTYVPPPGSLFGAKMPKNGESATPFRDALDRAIANKQLRMPTVLSRVFLQPSETDRAQVMGPIGYRGSTAEELKSKPEPAGPPINLTGGTPVLPTFGPTVNPLQWMNRCSAKQSLYGWGAQPTMHREMQFSTAPQPLMPFPQVWPEPHPPDPFPIFRLAPSPAPPEAKAMPNLMVRSGTYIHGLVLTMRARMDPAVQKLIVDMQAHLARPTIPRPVSQRAYTPRPPSPHEDLTELELPDTQHLFDPALRGRRHHDHPFEVDPGPFGALPHHRTAGRPRSPIDVHWTTLPDEPRWPPRSCLAHDEELGTPLGRTHSRRPLDALAPHEDDEVWEDPGYEHSPDEYDAARMPVRDHVHEHEDGLD